MYEAAARRSDPPFARTTASSVGTTPEREWNAVMARMPHCREVSRCLVPTHNDVRGQDGPQHFENAGIPVDSPITSRDIPTPAGEPVKFEATRRGVLGLPDPVRFACRTHQHMKSTHPLGEHFPRRQAIGSNIGNESNLFIACASKSAPSPSKKRGDRPSGRTMPRHSWTPTLRF